MTRRTRCCRFPNTQAGAGKNGRDRVAAHQSHPTVAVDVVRIQERLGPDGVLERDRAVAVLIQAAEDLLAGPALVGRHLGDEPHLRVRERRVGGRGAAAHRALLLLRGLGPVRRRRRRRRSTTLRSATPHSRCSASLGCRLGAPALVRPRTENGQARKVARAALTQILTAPA